MDTKYKGLCEEMRAVLQLEKEVADKKAKLREQIVAEAGGDRLEYGIKVQLVPGGERVDYRAMASELLGDDTVEKVKVSFSKKSSDTWRVTSY